MNSRNSGIDSALALAHRWKLMLDRGPRRGHAGRALGRATGSSLEFEDRRGYVPGDDLRHLDWRAFARTDELMVRRYREEIAPRVEVVLDASRSMGSDAAKARLARSLARLFAECARRDHYAVRVVVAGDEATPLEAESVTAQAPACAGRLPLVESLRRAASSLRPSAHVVLVSDGLAESEPRALLSPLARRAGSFTFVQLLSAFDAAPPRGGAFRLEDSESGAALELVLDDAAVSRYATRLARHCAALAEETRRLGGAFAQVIAPAIPSTVGSPVGSGVGSGVAGVDSEGPATQSPDLDALCRAVLLPAGVLEPR